MPFLFENEKQKQSTPNWRTKKSHRLNKMDESSKEDKDRNLTYQRSGGKILRANTLTSGVDGLILPEETSHRWKHSGGNQTRTHEEEQVT